MTGWTADVQVCTLAGVNISDCINASWSQPRLKEVKLEEKGEGQSKTINRQRDTVASWEFIEKKKASYNR